jgi:hypothetical protein
MFRRSSRSVRRPAALLLLALLFGWQSLASAMALPCRFQAPAATHTMSAHAASHEAHETKAAAHADHCAGMQRTKPSKPAHDCDGLCADRHCASVAFALSPTSAASAELPSTRVDALFVSQALRSGSPTELMRPPSRS